MFQKIVAKFAIYLLRHKNLSGESKALIMSALLDSVKALPIRKVISFRTDGTILIRGKILEKTDALNLLESAQMLSRNTFRKTLHEHIDFMAIEIGVHQGLTPEMIMFSKAAIWIHEQEREILSKIVTDVDNTVDNDEE